jgi:hypothetical protein
MGTAHSHVCETSYVLSFTISRVRSLLAARGATAPLISVAYSFHSMMVEPLYTLSPKLNKLHTPQPSRASKVTSLQFALHTYLNRVFYLAYPSIWIPVH